MPQLAMRTYNWRTDNKAVPCSENAKCGYGNVNLDPDAYKAASPLAIINEEYHKVSSRTSFRSHHTAESPPFHSIIALIIAHEGAMPAKYLPFSRPPSLLCSLDRSLARASSLPTSLCLCSPLRSASAPALSFLLRCQEHSVPALSFHNCETNPVTAGPGEPLPRAQELRSGLPLRLAAGGRLRGGSAEGAGEGAASAQ